LDADGHGFYRRKPREQRHGRKIDPHDGFNPKGIGSFQPPLNGKDPRDAIGTMLQIITGFAVLGGLIVILGLIVWFRVRKAASGVASQKIRRDMSDGSGLPAAE